MISLKSFIAGWNDFFYSKTDGEALCLFRIFFGIFLFINGISLIPDFHAWYGVGSDSFLPIRDSFDLYSDFRINLFKVFSPTEVAAWFILLSYVVSSFMLMVGFKTRAASIICFITLTSLQNRNYTILNSGDTVMRCMLFLMMFTPSQVMYSVDSWLKQRRGERYDTEVSYLSIRLLQLQFTLVYLATTLFKFKGLDWVDGTAIYYTARLENFQRIPLPILFDYAILVKTLTWGTLFIEFAMGTLIWVKELRKWVLLLGITLHIGIEVTMSIGIFEWVMMCSYLLFLEKEEISYLKRFIPQFRFFKLQRA